MIALQLYCDVVGNIITGCCFFCLAILVGQVVDLEGGMIGSHMLLTLVHAIGVVLGEVMEGGLALVQVIGVVLGQVVEGG